MSGVGRIWATTMFPSSEKVSLARGYNLCSKGQEDKKLKVEYFDIMGNVFINTTLMSVG